jgi:hypothetical protein
MAAAPPLDLSPIPCPALPATLEAFKMGLAAEGASPPADAGGAPAGCGASASASASGSDGGAGAGGDGEVFWTAARHRAAAAADQAEEYVRLRSLVSAFPSPDAARRRPCLHILTQQPADDAKPPLLTRALISPKNSKKKCRARGSASARARRADRHMRWFHAGALAAATPRGSPKSVADLDGPGAPPLDLYLKARPPLRPVARTAAARFASEDPGW